MSKPFCERWYGWHRWQESSRSESLTGRVLSGTYYCGGPCCDAGAGGSHEDRELRVDITYMCKSCETTKSRSETSRRRVTL